ncbi:MAG: WecB/TagA/CpsF family glycosyltransferase [Candidatus Omnitrophica bacterium]|nr:WecB/TagA/CpsF family glycosyltransferase [Candidatus Omnitrophota bacterium]
MCGIAGVRHRVAFFSAQLDPLTMEETLTRVDEIIRSRRVTQHVVVNVAKLVMMQRDPILREIVNACGLINADGQGIVWGARWLGLKIPERVAGIDLFVQLLPRAAQRGYRVYFLGASQDVVAEIVARCRRDYPTLQIAGWRNGYFSPEEEPRVVQAIKASGADMLFVAMSSPKKEFFLRRYADLMAVPFLMGVGGSFDVMAGKTTRAPRWMQRCGLEWLHRLLCEPGRMWKRYAVTNTVFLGMVLSAMLMGKRGATQWRST